MPSAFSPKKCLRTTAEGNANPGTVTCRLEKHFFSVTLGDAEFAARSQATGFVYLYLWLPVLRLYHAWTSNELLPVSGSASVHASNQDPSGTPKLHCLV